MWLSMPGQTKPKAVNSNIVFLVNIFMQKNQKYWCISSRDTDGKESCNLIGKEQFGLLNFPRCKVCTGKQRIVKSFSLGYLQQTVETNFCGTQENSILGLFLLILEWTRIFLEDPLLPRLSLSRFLEWCKISEKIMNRLREKLIIDVQNDEGSSINSQDLRCKSIQ